MSYFLFIHMYLSNRVKTKEPCIPLWLNQRDQKIKDTNTTKRLQRLGTRVSNPTPSIPTRSSAFIVLDFWRESSDYGRSLGFRFGGRRRRPYNVLEGRIIGVKRKRKRKKRVYGLETVYCCQGKGDHNFILQDNILVDFRLIIKTCEKEGNHQVQFQFRMVRRICFVTQVVMSFQVARIRLGMF